jgi:hypothetical protein
MFFLMFLPTYTIAVLVISIRQVNYAKVFEMKDLTEDLD